MSPLSLILVVLQFAGIIILGLTGPGFPTQPPAVALVGCGLGIGLWALWTMRKSRFRVLPEVAQEAHLITDGPYRFVRNPMYLAVLMATLGWVVETPSFVRWGVWAGIAITLALKLLYEERLLSKHFEDYPEYRRRIKRLIPGVW